MTTTHYCVVKDVVWSTETIFLLDCLEILIVWPLSHKSKRDRKKEKEENRLFVLIKLVSLAFSHTISYWSPEFHLNEYCLFVLCISFSMKHVLRKSFSLRVKFIRVKYIFLCFFNKLLNNLDEGYNKENEQKILYLKDLYYCKASLHINPKR